MHACSWEKPSWGLRGPQQSPRLTMWPLGGPCTGEACELILRQSFLLPLSLLSALPFSVLFLVILLVGCWICQTKLLFVLIFSPTFSICVLNSNFWSISFMSNTPIDVKKLAFILFFIFHFLLVLRLYGGYNLQSVQSSLCD